MSRTISFTHDGRDLEVRTHVPANVDMIEVWIFENEHTLQLVTAVPVERASEAKATGVDLIQEIMSAARTEVESGRLQLPPP
jgi:hypothetical protein